MVKALRLRRRRVHSGASLPYDFQAMDTRDRRDDPDDDDGDLTIKQAVLFTVLASAVLLVSKLQSTAPTSDRDHTGGTVGSTDTTSFAGAVAVH
jgi:hypothetical protein